MLTTLYICLYLLTILDIYSKQVTRIPWDDDPLSEETALISSELANINKQGVLTINSQPRANGVPSSDPVLGWGNPGGYIYQKVICKGRP